MSDAVLYADPTLGQTLRLFWRTKFYWLSGAVIGVCAAFFLLGIAVPHYRAEILIGPAERAANGPDIKALLPDNSSFAVQYLINTLGTSDSSDFMRFEQILRAPSVAAKLLEDKAVSYALVKDKKLRVLPDAAKIETPEKLAAYLQDKIAAEPVGTTPLRRIVYSHPDREFAVYMLEQVRSIADGIIRDEIRTRTETRAAYLQKAMAENHNPDHRRALTALLMEQEHVRMLLAMDEPFAAMVAEPAFAGARPAWPRKALVLPVFAFIGGLLGFAVYAMRRREQD